MVDGVEYFWIGAPKYEGNGVRRAFNIFTFVLKLAGLSGKIGRLFRPDVVIASSTFPIDIWPAARIATKLNAKLIFEVHDLWPLSPIEIGGMRPTHPFAKLMQYGEDYACRNADTVVSILPCAREYLVSRGMKAEKFVHIPNGVVPGDWEEDSCVDPPSTMSAAVGAMRRDERFVTMYAGAHGPANNLSLLLDIAERMTSDRVAFCLVGSGPEKPALQRAARERGLGNVHFFDPVSKRAVPATLALADALFFTLTPSPLFRFGISPNKLIDYMMAARPVIAAVEAGNNPVRDYSCGLSVPAGRADCAADAIRVLMRMSQHERLAMGNNGRTAVLESMTYQTLARKFADCFERATECNVRNEPAGFVPRRTLDS
jgi:glycosyltransferase involved in cell wall biosynthesis